MTLFNWITCFIGGGAVTWVALAIFAPGILNVVSAWLVAMAPLLQGISEGIVALAKRVWDGFLDVIDNVNTIIFVTLVVLAAVGYVYVATPKQMDFKSCVAELRKEYRFVPKTKTEKESWFNRTLENLWK